jgi:hypothetical protein
MGLDWKNICGIIAGVLSVAGMVPYFIGIKHGKVRPHLFTWLIQAVASAFMFFWLVEAGAGVSGATSQIFDTVIYTVLTVVSLRFFKKLIRPVDIVFMAFAAAAIGVWIILHDQNVAIYLLLTGCVLSYLPTVRKTWKLPYSESIPREMFSIASRIFIILSVVDYNFTTLLASLIWLPFHLFMIAMMLIRRRKINNESEAEFSGKL